MLKVLIVDDEPMILEVLEAYIKKENYDVYLAENGEEALQMFHSVHPHFVILDLMLPDLSGESVCQQIRKTSDVPIMMLTAKGQENDRINGIEIGADDYIVKPFSPREVIVRMKSILKRTGYLYMEDSLSFNNGELTIFPAKKLVYVNDESVSLTPIEFQLITQMANRPGYAFTRAELLKTIQDAGYFEGYERNIDVHIKNIRKKIEEDTKHPKYILTVFGTGYRFGGES
ncbi:response regulator [Thalassobacillus sp. B23F22_16]|uniref:response regulator n=1 Tax=Thalassobacillus sp. B23F22_16 TaxID=3459513 RepID=UPI00373F3F6E